MYTKRHQRLSDCKDATVGYRERVCQKTLPFRIPFPFEFSFKELLRYLNYETVESVLDPTNTDPF